MLLASATPPTPPAPPADPARRFDDLVSGRRSGLGARLLRAGLWLASLAYGSGIRVRNLAFARGWSRVQRAAVPVISVGNLTVGGTGKTPCVEYVAGWFSARDCRVAILSRGYGSMSGPNDEALVLEENLPNVPHLQGVDRAALAAIAVEELESQLLVLDDGFQHRRLARDLDIVLIDGTRPWGYGHLLPRGLLREPASSLLRAHAVLLTRCDQVDAAQVTALRQRIERIAPGVPIAESVHRPQMLMNAEGETEQPSHLAARPVAAVCGIGNPDAFRRTLEALGYRLVDVRVYPDHHAYALADVEQLHGWAESLPDDAAIVTTQKDMVKLRLNELGGRPLWALRIGLEVTAGEDVFHEMFARILGRVGS